MTRRTKHEAEVRLSIGVARVALRNENKSAAEAVEAVRNHLALMKSLEQPQAQSDDSELLSRKVSRAE